MPAYEEISSENCFPFYIRKFWILDNSLSPLQTVLQYALPNTCFTLAFIIGNGVLLEYPDKKSRLVFGSYLVGQLTTKVSVTVLPYTKAFMVQLNPWAASLLSELSFHELTNQVIELRDVNQKIADSIIRDDLIDSKCFKNTMEKIFVDYLYPTKDSMLIASCFHLFRNQPIGHLNKIADLSAHTGYSIRSLEKKFKQNVGLSPKQVHMILRVRSLIDEIQLNKNGKVSLTTLAYRYGFSDQAHFIRTYRNMMDSAPSKFDRAEYILPLFI